jgi:hypothetical protein
MQTDTFLLRDTHNSYPNHGGWRIMADRSQCLERHVAGKDAKKTERVMEALLQMKKIDIQGLRKAYAG